MAPSAPQTPSQFNESRPDAFSAFANRRILLLQGPVGPFFAHLARDLRSVGAQVFKVNFNAGDWFFYPRGALNYRGSLGQWPKWLEEQLRELQIDLILLFGDCRPIHVAARSVAAKLGVEHAVFEEGYVRPNFVTLERFGVNGYSRLAPPDVEAPASTPRVEQPVGDSYWPMAWHAFRYFLVARLGRGFFAHYEHHRSMQLRQGLLWIRSAWRKVIFRWQERHALALLTTQFPRQFFLVPLQVFNDAQVTCHAPLQSVEQFIETVLWSFARNADAQTRLVFKHHPMDRGYRDYSALIERLSTQAGVSERVLYIHDQHLPTLLKSARGVIVINSTVGLSALHHKVPTFVYGTAIYDMPGLTYQGDLETFWQEAPHAKPDAKVVARYRQHLISHTQLNGSFYRPLRHSSAKAGLIWTSRFSVPPVRSAALVPIADSAPAATLPERHSEQTVAETAT